MAMTKKERTQVLGLLIAVGVGAPVGFWAYWRNPKIEEVGQIQFRCQALSSQSRRSFHQWSDGTQGAVCGGRVR